MEKTSNALDDVFGRFARHQLDDTLCVFLTELPEPLVLDPCAFRRLWDSHPPRMHDEIAVSPSVCAASWCEAYRDDDRDGVTDPAPIVLEHVVAWCKARIDARLDGVLVNWFSAEFAQGLAAGRYSAKATIGAPVVIVSLGAERVLRLRAPAPGACVHDIRLTNGRVVVMPPEIAERWIHEVPHRPRDHGHRISVILCASAERAKWRVLC